MKKLCIMLSLLATLTFTSVTAHAIVGEGTSEEPFVITTQEDLEFINDYPADYYVLGNNIALEGTWEPLCTYSDDFSGVLDGRGYTISNLTLGSYRSNGLFKVNNGTIKNLNVSTAESNHVKSYFDSGDFYWGLIASTNNGTIQNCDVSGNLSVYDNASYSNTMYLGAATGKNTGTVENITSNVSFSITRISTRNIGGIVGENTADAKILHCSARGNLGGGHTGGIVSRNYGTVSNSYYIGGEEVDGGIACYCYEKGVIENCYAAANNSSSGIVDYYYTGRTVTNCFYDRSITSATDTAKGTPKTTQGMKMKRTYTSADWDFENTWGINPDINGGYPYLLWEHPNAEELPRYTLNSIKMKDTAGEEISEMPADSFYVEINATKNDNSKNADTLIIAAYDENGALLDMKFMTAKYYQNQTVDFGAAMNNGENKIKTLKAFVWDSVNGMIPLSNAVSSL